jgi:hypothetical protein
LYQILYIQTPSNFLTNPRTIVEGDSALFVEIEAKNPSSGFSSVFNIDQLNSLIEKDGADHRPNPIRNLF